MPLPRLLQGLVLTFLGAASSVTAALPEAAADSAAARGHRVAVLDPVDLRSQSALRPLGDTLRGIFAALPGWRPVPLDSMGEKSFAPCHEYQCAFDVGVNLLSEFVVFGTATELDGWRAYTLDIIHVASAQAVWAEAGQFQAADDAAA